MARREAARAGTFGEDGAAKVDWRVSDWILIIYLKVEFDFSERKTFFYYFYFYRYQYYFSVLYLIILW